MSYYPERDNNCQELSSKENFYSSLTGKKLVTKNMIMF